MAISLEFSYLPGLDIIAVVHSVANSPVALDPWLLANLFPGDMGNDNPNLIKQFKMDALKFVFCPLFLLFVVFCAFFLLRGHGSNVYNAVYLLFSFFYPPSSRMNAFEEYLDTIGKPFRWAQALGGLHAVTISDTDAGTSRQQERQALVQVLKAIRRRVDARVSLAKQHKSLGKEKGKIKKKE